MFDKEGVLVSPTGKNGNSLDVYAICLDEAKNVCLRLRLVRGRLGQEGARILTSTWSASSMVLKETTFHPCWAFQNQCFVV